MEQINLGGLILGIYKFIDSKDMREYLRTVQLSERTCEDLVCGAPRPLSEKVAWLEQQGSARAEKARQALDALNLRPREFLLVFDEWYDDDCFGRSHDFGVPLSPLEAALEHIRYMIAEYRDEGSLCWNRMERWRLCKHGSSFHYSYFLIRDEIVYFEGLPMNMRNCFCGAPDLDLPIPFNPGDIVKIDCTPFMPPKPVVLLEVNNNDCCGATCLFRREEDGNWEVGQVKHSHCWAKIPRVYPVISPLYRLASFRGNLGEGERLLEKVSKYIDGDVKKGQGLWANLSQTANRFDRCWLEEREISSFLE